MSVRPRVLAHVPTYTLKSIVLAQWHQQRSSECGERRIRHQSQSSHTELRHRGSNFFFGHVRSLTLVPKNTNRGYWSRTILLPTEKTAGMLFRCIHINDMVDRFTIEVGREDAIKRK